MAAHRLISAMATPPKDMDVLVIGGGVVGLAIARQLLMSTNQHGNRDFQHRSPSICLVEMSSSLSWSTSFRNSGVGRLASVSSITLQITNDISRFIYSRVVLHIRLPL